VVGLGRQCRSLAERLDLDLWRRRPLADGECGVRWSFPSVFPRSLERSDEGPAPLPTDEPAPGTYVDPTVLWPSASFSRSIHERLRRDTSGMKKLEFGARTACMYYQRSSLSLTVRIASQAHEDWRGRDGRIVTQTKLGSKQSWWAFERTGERGRLRQDEWRLRDGEDPFERAKRRSRFRKDRRRRRGLIRHELIPGRLRELVPCVLGETPRRRHFCSPNPTDVRRRAWRCLSVRLTVPVGTRRQHRSCRTSCSTTMPRPCVSGWSPVRRPSDHMHTRQQSIKT
jgi:hypothetical protein